jgi:16S rRNA G966 N2-methylase RsmD
LPIKIIKENLEITRLMKNAEIKQMDAFTLLESVPDRKFDYVFIAPPQYKQMWVKGLRLLDRNLGWLADDAWIIVQIDPLELEPISLTTLVEFDQRRYGNTLLIFYSSISLEEE